jgi:hypothetical protein
MGTRRGLNVGSPDFTTVYRFYDKEGELLYVGISREIGARFDGHRFTQAWWKDVVRAEFEHFLDRVSAAQREKELIQTLRPKHNKQHAEYNRQSRRPVVLHPLLGAAQKGKLPMASMEVLAKRLEHLLEEEAFSTEDRIPYKGRRH